MVLSNTTSLLIVSALIEMGAGLLFLITPSTAATLLLGAGLVSPESVLFARVAGAALFSFAMSCWLERNRDPGVSLIGLVAGVLVYNAAVVVLLVYAALVSKMNGIGMWPAVGVHSALLIWCAARLRGGRGR